jgi:YVTN family beta-propeller protein|nr:hypothetical protein [Kofleriaceae bacterium]
MRSRWLSAVLLSVACGGGGHASDGGGGDGSGSNQASVGTAHGSSIAITGDGKTLYVVNADADSVSVIDTASKALTKEILLGGAHPAVDGSGAYTPAIMPRALALSPDGATLWVTGERAGALFAVDAATGVVSSPIAVGSEPVGVVASADGAAVFVACSQDGTVVRVDAASRAVTATATTGGEPWQLGFSPNDGALVATLMHGPGVAVIDPATMAVRTTTMIPDLPARGDRRLAHGQVRGLYDVAARPTTGELWVAHLVLGTDTAQPSLDFESTVFPGVSVLSPAAFEKTLTVDAPDVAGVDGSFGDITSGPHAMAFTSDGALAIVVDTNSEDLLAIDARSRVEVALLRPLPGHMPEGIVLSPDDNTAYVDERNTGDVAVVTIDHTGAKPALAVTGTIARFASGGDPMPAQLRLGQHLFYSANSDEYPITKNHWVACSSCHVEGRSDEVTWKFAQGPRDTPSNAGGTLGTGLLFRTADRNDVQDYFRTINTEQGGSFGSNDGPQKDLLDALEAYVDHAIPLPVPPTTDPTLVARGKTIFESQAVGCTSCHSGAHFTDSGVAPDGSGAATLEDPNLHDATQGSGIGTCVTTGYVDVDHLDIDGNDRAACSFDTPSLSGVASSPPYLHDGSAPTLRDVLEKTRGHMGDITSLGSDDETALIEYLRSL